MNYRRAADALHLTQPAVTKQIQALEAQYGVKLFSYDERKLRKTPQGEILERYAIGLQYNDAEAYAPACRKAEDAASHQGNEIHRRLHSHSGNPALFGNAG